MSEIKDFGEKIGGAKKDLWKIRGLNLDDILSFNELEKEKYIKKDNIWIKPKYEELIQEGYSKNALYFIKTVRDSIPAKITKHYDDTAETYTERQNAYIEFVNEIKTELLKIKTDSDIDDFGIDFFINNGYVQKDRYSYSIQNVANDFINNKLFKSVQTSHRKIEQDALAKNFLLSDFEIEAKDYKIFKIGEDGSNKVLPEITSYDKRLSIVISNSLSKSFMYPSEETLKDISLYKDNTYIICKNNNVLYATIDSKEKAESMVNQMVNINLQLKSSVQTTDKKQRKQKLVPPQLEHIKCPDRHNGKNVSGENYIETFNFKGGEFGNWLNEKDRQVSLNYGYDSFKDLAKALNISDKDIAMSGLSIAFGARGSGNALAHYEIERNVINLTKMKGAGSLSHEWGHALDAYVGQYYGCKTFATEDRKRPKIISDICQTMKFKSNDEGGFTRTDFFQNAIDCDKKYAKADKGYWQSEIEMFARSFACYVSDKLNEPNDYLTGHADFNNKISPQGEERTKINKQFDILIEKMKELELFYEPILENQISENIEPFQISLSEQLAKVKQEANSINNDNIKERNIIQMTL